MAPRGFTSRHWNSWRSSPRSCPCRACTSCAMGVPGAAQPPARGDQPPAPPAGCRRGGDGHGVAALELGAVAPARACPRHGTLSFLPAGDAADDRRHHTGRGDPENPPASETGGGPTPDCPGASPPGSVRLVLHLTASTPPSVAPSTALSQITENRKVETRK